jgi:hypothetical protein
LIKDATCEICGCEESAYHVVIQCTKPTALRFALRQHWALPYDEKLFTNTGPDWLLLLLYSVDSDTKSKILLLLWRAWHLWNNIIHDQGEGFYCEISGLLVKLFFSNKWRVLRLFI